MRWSALLRFDAASDCPLGRVGIRAPRSNRSSCRPATWTSAYDVTRPQQPKVRERVRWLAGEHLERVDASGRSTSIFDRDAHVVTLLTPATRTFRKLDKAPRRPSEPEPGAALKRGGEAVVAGLPCTDWSWTEEGGNSTPFAPPPTASSCA